MYDNYLFTTQNIENVATYGNCNNLRDYKLCACRVIVDNSTTMHYKLLLQSRRGQSPHHVSTPSRSPSHSPHPPKDGEPSDRVGNVVSRGGASGEERGTGSGPDGKPGPRNALLQVSEAHLAILPDEDGDT